MTVVYQIFLAPRAEKELDRVPSEFFNKIDKAITGLSRNPRPFGVKKLDENIHRIRIGDWRVIYAILENEKRILVLHVARRNEKTYKNF